MPAHLPPARPASAGAPADLGIDDSNDVAALQRARKAIGIGADEAEFRGVVPLEAQEYWWKERHKPRRPKFFNKVHTGALRL